MPFFLNTESLIRELIDVVIMTLAVGFIFHKQFAEHKPVRKDYDPLKEHTSWFDFDGFWFTVAVTAPAVIAHELAHKVVAVLFGLVAVFHAAYTWLAIGVVLRLINFPLLFFVPGYVSIYGIGSPVQGALISFAGPGLNLVLWVGSWLLLKDKRMRKRYGSLLALTEKINMFLFIFNMLPIPGFDGWSVYTNLFKVMFG